MLEKNYRLQNNYLNKANYYFTDKFEYSAEKCAKNVEMAF